MGIGHLFQIGDDLFCKADITGELLRRVVLPGGDVHLIDVHGAFVGDVLFLFQHPFPVSPYIFTLKQLGGGAGPALIVCGIRVCLIQNAAVLCLDAVFIAVKLFQAGQFCFPDCV